MQDVVYTSREEKINVISHIIGLVLSLLIGGIIIYRNIYIKESMKVVAWIIYIISISLMFLASSLYHSAKNKKKRYALRAFDHCAIFITIAGSYTPSILVGLNNKFSNVFFIIIRSLALIGIIIKLRSFIIRDVSKSSVISMAIYMIMGWLALVLSYQIVKNIGLSYMIFLVIGGVFYTLGSLFYANKKLKYNHAIWHIFILVATFIMLTGNIIYLA